MVKRKSILKKAAVLLTLTAVLSSLTACGSAKTSDPSNEASQSSDKNFKEENNDDYTQTELTDDEKVPVYTYSSDDYYHLTDTCKGDDEEAMVLLKKPAENCGYLPCPKCAGEKEK